IPQSEETEQNSNQPNSQAFWSIPTTLVYRYPELDSKCKMPIFFVPESDYFRSSPDGRYLAIPGSNPKPQGEFASSGRVLSSSELYDLQSCSEVNIAEHLALRLTNVGEFSADSRYYLMQNASFRVGNHTAFGAIKFNLQTGEIVEKIPERIWD
ncbi:MAG: hypothetical protein WA865_22295, partial [Spirulinaceae cyanobacterium]